MATKVLELFYIGDDFYKRSGRMMNAIHEAGTYNRYGWTLLPDDLAKGYTVTIRPATAKELRWANREVEKWERVNKQLKEGRGLKYYDKLLQEI